MAVPAAAQQGILGFAEGVQFTDHSVVQAGAIQRVQLILRNVIQLPVLQPVGGNIRGDGQQLLLLQEAASIRRKTRWPCLL